MVEYIMVNKYIITFAGGPSNYHDQYGRFINYFEAAQRLISQARATKLFDDCTIYTDQGLQADPEFWSQHGPFIANNSRGYGYWLWKPYIIRKTLEKMCENDLLIYSDAGCEICFQMKSQIEELFTIATTDLIIGSTVGNEWGPEIHWVKKDLLLLLDIQDEDPLLRTQQRQATAVCLKKCDQVMKLVDEWYRIAGNYHMIDDTPSRVPNLPEFREHRHDQSIFSLLTKKYNMYSTHPITTGIFLSRAKSGVSLLPNTGLEDRRE